MINNKIAAEYTLEIGGKKVPLKIGYKAYAHVEEKTGVLFSELIEGLRSIRVLAYLIEGAVNAAGMEVTHDQVGQWLDDNGTDFFLRPLIEALTPDDEVVEQLKEFSDNSETKKK